MPADFESVHPRSRSGAFAVKRQSTPETALDSLPDRIERLRAMPMGSADLSVAYMTELLRVSEDAAATGEYVPDRPEDASPLAAIFATAQPKDLPLIVGNIVREVDMIATEVGKGTWSPKSFGERLVRGQVRKTMKKFGLPRSGAMFDRVYGYVAVNY